MKNLPIGIQSFADQRNNNYFYLDKTGYVYKMITSGKIYFLSRPRRFGKSLLVSTLDAVFKAQKDLFEGLYIYDRWDWTQKHPVIRLDFGERAHATPEKLESSLYSFINEIAENYSLTLNSPDLPDRFSELIKRLHLTTGKQVVVLVDEYDKPITDHLSNLEIMEANKTMLHDFYQVLKAADEHIRFVFLTGVSKFSGISVFSALNNLRDITLSEDYATLCGYTQQELESYFTEYIDDVASHVEMNREELLDAIRKWYNGYSWNGKTPVYNPFSTLLFFVEKQFDNYWFRTGTPTFLINLLKSRNQTETILEPIQADSGVFDSYDPANISEIPLLFQTGYLTIKRKELIYGQPHYTLEMPNSEVRHALLRHLLSAYSVYPVEEVQPLIYKMQRQVRDKDAAGMERNLRMMLAHIPAILHVKSEAYYHSLLLLWIKMLGFDIQGEVMTDIGRIDAVWHQPGLTVVAEIKYHAEKEAGDLLDAAMLQIRNRRYYEPYLDRKVVLMAVAFTGKDVKCRMETMTD
jgi:hypothetical protein